ncbi:MAG: hypothetical protein VX704_03340, partial [Verrucomicrobiota bacterium]|nr:hypothetical protein [Verrucomicrobiota bacterium]
MTEPDITPEVVKEHGITPEEYEHMLEILGRELLGQGDLFGGDSSGLSSYRLVKGDTAEACLLLIKIKRNQSLFF